jgi:hypothetical protein
MVTISSYGIRSNCGLRRRKKKRKKSSLNNIPPVAGDIAITGGIAIALGLGKFLLLK